MKKAIMRTEHLAVGYLGKVVVDDINVEVERGKILTLIGPNGAGKSTILKSITRQLEIVSGTVYIDDDVSRLRDSFGIDSELFAFNDTASKTPCNTLKICHNGTFHEAPVRLKPFGY